VRSSEVKNRSLVPRDSKRGALAAFAYVGEGIPAANTTATVEYGRGVSDVSDDPGAADYNVTFASSVRNCVVQATSGAGDPDGVAAGFEGSFPRIVMSEGPGAEVEITFFNHAGSVVDTGFLITAFC